MQAGDIRLRHAEAVDVVAEVAQALLDRRIVLLDLLADLEDSTAKVYLEDLTDVHAGRDAQRVQHDVDRRAIRQERHVFLAHDARDDTLVTVTACHLIADRDLALLSDVDADEAVDAWRQLIVVLAAEDLDVDDLALLAVRDAQRRVADLACLLTEDGAQQALLCRELRLAFRRDLADEDIARTYVGTDRDDAFFIEVLQSLFGDIRDVARDLFRAEFRITCIALVFLDVDGRVDIAFDEVLGEQDSILVVVAFPRHVRNDDVVAECQLAVVRCRAVCDWLLLLYFVALIDNRDLVDTGALVGTQEFLQFVVIEFAALRADIDVVRRDFLDDTGALGEDHDARVAGSLVLHARADERSLRAQKRYGLALHVRAHQGTVRIVVLEEWDHRRRDGEDLARAHVHVVDGLARVQARLFVVAGRDALVDEPLVLVERLIGLCDDELVLFIGRQVADFVRHAMVFLVDAAVRRLHEAELIDARIRGQRADKTDVRTFWGLDRAHAAVMGVVDIADFEACALTGETARAKGRETALMRELRQRVVLVHELRELGGTEEFLDRSDDRTDVDEGLRRDDVDVLDRHALADDALHAREADAELILQQFTDCADAAVAEMVDIVRRAEAIHEVQQVADRCEDVVLRDRAVVDVERRRAEQADLRAVLLEQEQRDEVALTEDLLLALHVDSVKHVFRDDFALWDDNLTRLVIDNRLCEDLAEDAALPAELLRQLVAADRRKVVALRVEEQRVEELRCIVLIRRLARTQALVDLDDSLALRLDLLAIALNRVEHAWIVAEELDDLLIRIETECADEIRHRHLARAVDADRDDIIRIRLELDPCAAVRDDRRIVEVLAGRIDLLAVVGARRTNELADDDTFCTIDDERTRIGHEREIAHEYFLLFDFACLAIDKADIHPKRCCQRHIALLAFVEIVFRLAEREALEGQDQISGETLDW